MSGADSFLLADQPKPKQLDFTFIDLAPGVCNQNDRIRLSKCAGHQDTDVWNRFVKCSGYDYRLKILYLDRDRPSSYSLCSVLETADMAAGI